MKSFFRWIYEEWGKVPWVIAAGIAFAVGIVLFIAASAGIPQLLALGSAWIFGGNVKAWFGVWLFVEMCVYFVWMMTDIANTPPVPPRRRR